MKLGSESDTRPSFTPLQFCAVLGAFLFAAFPKVALGLQTFVYRDFGVLAYPSVFYYHESFWRGELPLWNPLSNCGAPFLAQWGTMVLYPFSLFYVLLPLPWSLNFFCLAHLFWAGLGMYWLALRWVENRFAASVAGIAFVFNGVTFSCLIWPNYTVALGWMPWVVLCVERACRHGGRSIVAAAVVAALQMLSGVPEIVLLTWGLILGIWGGMVVKQTTAVRSLVLRNLAIVLLASGLMAAQLLPFFDLLSHSQRGADFATSKWAMPVWGWANLLVPLFRSYPTPQGVFFQMGQQFMSSTYLGIATLALALLAVAVVRRRRVWLLGSAALLSLILALGENGILYGWIRETLPFLGFARYPVKFALLTVVVIPLLASFAVRTLQDAPFSWQGRLWQSLGLLWGALVLGVALILWVAHRYPLPLDLWPATWRNGVDRAFLLTATLGLLVASGALQKRASRLAAQIGVLALLALDSVTHTPNQNPAVPTSALTPGVWELSNNTPPPKHGEGRVMISPQAEARLLRSTVPNLFDDLLGKRLALWSHLNLLESAPKVNGSSTLQLREQAQIQALLYASTNLDFPRLADFLGVSYETAKGQIIEWTPRRTFMPFISAGQRPVFAAAADTLSALANSNFKPQEIVYLPRESKAAIAVTNQTTARVAPKQFSAHQIDLEIEASQPSVVVVAQSFYHPWRAYVDGMLTTLWRANHAFQALEVPAGRHEVSLRYEDRRFKIGAVISLLTLVCCASLWFGRKRG